MGKNEVALRAGAVRCNSGTWLWTRVASVENGAGGEYGGIHRSASNKADPDLQARCGCLSSDLLGVSRGWVRALVRARWRSEERRKRYLLLPLYLGLFMHAGVMGKERSERIWILGDVMMTEFENPSLEG